MGVFWGWFFFRELRGAGAGNGAKVLGGAVAIVAAAILLGYASAHLISAAPTREMAGIAAAIGAGLLWGTMYIPYRKAYLSGMNPLSFVTMFTVGELAHHHRAGPDFSRRRGPAVRRSRSSATDAFLALPRRILLGDWRPVSTIRRQVHRHRPRNSAARIRTNSGVWRGARWYSANLLAAVGETQGLVIAGSAVMILGATAISSAAAHESRRSIRPGARR